MLTPEPFSQAIELNQSKEKKKGGNIVALAQGRSSEDNRLTDFATHRPVFDIFTDGSCLGNPGQGGWACIIRDRPTGEESEYRGGLARTTNNVMELRAVIQGLRQIPAGGEVHLWSDSQYVLRGIRDWLPDWKRRNWRKADKKPVLNVELWKEIDYLLQKHDVHVHWIRGHAGHEENERCDALAREQAEMVGLET